MAMRASACEAKPRRASNSASRMAKKLSAMGLSWASPTEPMDGRTPASAQRLPKAREVYCLGSSGRRNTCVPRSQQLVKGLGRRSPSKRLARPTVERRGYRGESFRAVGAQVCALREVLSQQPVGVLVRPALPRAVRIAEVDLHAGVDPQLCMLAQLRPLVPGQRSSQPLRQGGDRARDGVAHRLRAMAGERGPVL